MFLKLRLNHHETRAQYHYRCAQTWTEHLHKQTIHFNQELERVADNKTTYLALKQNAERLFDRINSYIAQHLLWIEHHDRQVKQLGLKLASPTPNDKSTAQEQAPEPASNVI